MSQILFKCPCCDSTQFRVSSQPKSVEDFIGAPCSACGAPLTEDEIKKQALKIAEKAAKKAFRDSGMG
jgi:hypothetical protein